MRHTSCTFCGSQNQERRASRSASRCAISSIFSRIASMGDRSSTELVSAKTSGGALPIASSSSKAERKPAYASCAPPSLRMTSSVSCCGVVGGKECQRGKKWQGTRAGASHLQLQLDHVLVRVTGKREVDQRVSPAA